MSLVFVKGNNSGRQFYIIIYWDSFAHYSVPKLDLKATTSLTRQCLFASMEC